MEGYTYRGIYWGLYIKELLAACNMCIVITAPYILHVDIRDLYVLRTSRHLDTTIREEVQVTNNLAHSKAWKTHVRGLDTIKDLDTIINVQIISLGIMRVLDIVRALDTFRRLATTREQRTETLRDLATIGGLDTFWGLNKSKGFNSYGTDPGRESGGRYLCE